MGDDRGSGIDFNATNLVGQFCQGNEPRKDIRDQEKKKRREGVALPQPTRCLKVAERTALKEN